MRHPAEFHPVLKACAVLAVVTLPMLLGGAAPKPRSVALPATPTFTEQVDVVRDSQGVPHIFATTANGAFYGLGFASAEDRLFQMNLLRWTMRGRLAEYLDSTQFDLIIDQDKTARILGWGAHADLQAASLTDPESQAILTAYAQGVNYFTNRYISIHGALPPTFQQLGIAQIDPWTPADSLLCWMFIQTVFEGGWQSEVAADGNPGSCPPNSTVVVDPAGAVVQQPWSPPFCLEDLKKGRRAIASGPPEFKKASHNLVLAGKRSTSNSAVMLGKPQLFVTNPGILYEFAAKGGSYDCRGAGVAGFPGLLVGWNRNISWSVTAMGGDTSDLFRLSTPATNPPNTYVLDGAIKAMTNVHTEIVLVKGGNPVPVDHAETVWGPVVTSLIPATNPPNPNQGYAACHQILRDKAHHTIESMLGLMRATDWCSARAAMALWRGPGVHMLYGDLQGNIGYTSLVALPIRSLNDPCPIYPGCQPQDGSLSSSAWVGEVAFSDHPWSFNPPEGFLVTANNLAADPATTPGNRQFGGPGDTERSWRLRELLTGLLNDPTNPNYPNIKLTPSQTLAIDHDSVNAVLRVTAELAAIMLQAGTITGGAASAAQQLGQWNNGVPASQYWQMLPSVPIYPVLLVVADFVGKFRVHPNQTWNNLVITYGAGASGLVNFLRHAEANLQGFAAMTDVQNWMQDRLSNAWTEYTNNPPTGYTQFKVYYEANARLEAIDSHGPKSLLPSQEYTVTLLCPFGGTIWSQPGEAYKFHATMRNIDNSKAMLPPGVSEDFTATTLFRNHESDWLAGNMYAAPITQSIVVATAMSTTTLQY